MKVVQWDDEPAWSLVQRLAAQHGTGTARQFCHDHGLDPASLTTTRGIEQLAELGGYDAEKLFASSPVNEANGAVRIGRERIASQDAFTSEIRLCPVCLRDDLASERGTPRYRAHYRQWWTFKDFLCCPVHGVRLIEGETFDRTTSDPRHAAGDDRDLSSVVPVPADDSSFEQYVLGRLGFSEPIRSSILDALQLNLAMRVAFRIGYHAIHGTDTTVDESCSPDARIEAQARGMAILLGDGTGLVGLFDAWFRAAEPPKGNWGPRAVYGKLYDWLNQERRWTKEAYDPVRDIIREHALARFPVNPNEEFFGQKIEERRIFTLAHIWTETGIHQSRLRPILLKLGMIEPEQAERADWHVFIDANQMREFREVAADLLNGMEAMAYLGIPRGTYASLRREGWIEPFLQTGSLEQGEVVYRRSALDKWIADMAGDAALVQKPGPGQAPILNTKRMLLTSTGDLIGLLRSGRIRCTGRLSTAKPFEGILLDLGEVRREIAPRTTDMLRPAEAMAELGTTHYVFRDLVERGHIQRQVIEYDARSRDGVAYRKDDIVRFNREFMAMKEAAAWLGTHTRVLRAKVAPLGVVPAIEIDAGPASSFYRRSEIEALPKDCMRSPRGRRNL